MSRQYIVEIISMGKYVRVTAMDPETLTEVSIVGDPSAGEGKLRQLAIQKLEYVLKKNKPTPPSSGGGIVV